MRGTMYRSVRGPLCLAPGPARLETGTPRASTDKRVPGLRPAPRGELGNSTLVFSFSFFFGSGEPPSNLLTLKYYCPRFK